MALLPIFSWSLQSPDGTVWVPSVSTAGIVTWTSGGAPITLTSPVYQGTPNSKVWIPRMTDAGIPEKIETLSAGQRWAALIDPNGVRWYFTVNAFNETQIGQKSVFLLDEVALYNTCLSAARITAHYAARLDGSYATEVLTDAPQGYWRLGEYPIRQRDIWSQRPIGFALNGINHREWLRVDTLEIDDTLGQPVSAEFTLVNPDEVPVAGDEVRITFFDQVIFAGTIDQVQKTSPDLRTVFYRCDCVDWSQILLRRKLRRNFTNMPVQNILDSILDNELATEGLTIGTIDSRATMPLLDAQNARVFDVCRDLAGATGQSFYVDFDRSIQMRSTTVDPAPLLLNETTVQLQGTAVKSDRETYRNVQVVVVTGTPPDRNTDALTVVIERRNDAQILERQAIEGGTGRYEEIEEVTHPTSNDGVILALLGIGYAQLRLATSGALRQTTQLRVRHYGLRAGQLAIVDLPTFGLSGTFIIQRVSTREEAAQSLVYDLELTSSSLQQRAYESWLAVVKKGTVTMQLPGSLTNNLQTFETPGTYIFIVPAGVVSVEVTCVGGSAAGSGGAAYTGLQNGNPPYPCDGGGQYTDAALGVNGGRGGNSGRAVTVLTVIEGETITLLVGSAGVAGVSDSNVYHNLSSGSEAATGTDGTIGNPSQATYRGVVVCKGDGGKKGTHGRVTIALVTGSSGRQQRICLFPGTNAANNAAGIGDGVSVGGGNKGGVTGKGIPFVQPGPGVDGRVEVRW